MVYNYLYLVCFFWFGYHNNICILPGGWNVTQINRSIKENFYIKKNSIWEDFDYFVRDTIRTRGPLTSNFYNQLLQLKYAYFIRDSVSLVSKTRICRFINFGEPLTVILRIMVVSEYLFQITRKCFTLLRLVMD